jgi:hypothetical protein
MWLAPSPRRGGPSPRPISIAGSVVPSKYSALKGRGFSSFYYDAGALPPVTPKQQAYGGMPAEGQGSLSARASSPRQAMPGTLTSPRTSIQNRAVFSVRSLPPAPKQAGAFQRFRYSLNPYEDLEDHKRQELRQDRIKTIGGAFSAGGNARDAKRSLKIRAPELKAQLLKTLRADWPSFVRVAWDVRGLLLASFAAERLSTDRRNDLHAYMNRLLTTHPASAEFSLNREPTQWGVVQLGGGEGNPALIVYALRPPWVPNDVMAAAKSLLEQPGPSGSVSGGGALTVRAAPDDVGGGAIVASGEPTS